MDYTVGKYLSRRIGQLGIKDHFALPGDFNLTLLDEFLEEGSSKPIASVNELNCGYSAEGYARENGISAMIITFSVGSLSCVNSVASMYAESLPCIVISGGPNTNDVGNGKLIHHSLAVPNYDYCAEVYRQVTAHVEVIKSPLLAPGQIDTAIGYALRESKPVYIEIACNIFTAPCAYPAFSDFDVQRVPKQPIIDAAVEATLKKFRSKKDCKTVILVGSRTRTIPQTQKILPWLAEKLDCAVYTMGSAKTMYPETNKYYRGIYWGEISWPNAKEAVEEADVVIAVGPIFNDYTTVGWTATPDYEKLIFVDIHRLSVCGQDFAFIEPHHYFEALGNAAASEGVSFAHTLEKPLVRPALKETSFDGSQMTVHEIARQIGKRLTPETTLIAETGDSWFISNLIEFPEGARCETEMQWGSIGWSVPCAFGTAMANRDRRVILMVGDGSFQLTVQEIAQMVRYNVPVIMVLINNHGYVIESMIHEGPYNYIKNWKYAGLMDIFNANQGDGLGITAMSTRELKEGLDRAVAHTAGPVLIECLVSHEDCTRELVVWGKQVAAANSRKPASD